MARRVVYIHSFLSSRAIILLDECFFAGNFREALTARFSTRNANDQNLDEEGEIREKPREKERRDYFLILLWQPTRKTELKIGK